MSRPEADSSLGLYRVLCIAAAVWSIAAGVIHFLSVGEHRAHALMAAFFVGTAVAQVGWGVWLVLRPSRWLLLAGIAGNLVVLGVWVFSRTTGLPFIGGAEHPEPIGFKDVAATLLEALAAGAGGLALAVSGTAAAVVLTAARRSVAVASVVALLLVVPATLVQGQEHGHGGEAHAQGAYGEHALGADDHRHGGSAGKHAGHDDHAAQGADEHGSAGQEHGTHQASSGGQAHGPGGHEHAGGDHGSQAGGGHDHADGSHGHGARQETFPQPRMWGTKTTFRIGPFPLGAGSRTGGMHFNRFLPAPGKPCSNCYITGFVPKLVYADGTTADVDSGPMLHHIVLFDSGRIDRTCRRWNGDGMMGQRIFASGNERQRVSMPRGFGIPSSSSPWGYAAEIMNSGEELKTVYLDLDVYYVPKSTPGIKPVTPVWMDVANCRASEYPVPAGRSVKRRSWESSLTGRVVSAGGHVHSGGVGTIVRNATTNRRICTSEAAYGVGRAFGSEVVDMSSCVWDRLGTVRKGQRLEIASIYDTKQAADEMMGISVLYVYETADLSGGSPAPAWMRRDPDTDPPDSGHHH